MAKQQNVTVKRADAYHDLEGTIVSEKLKAGNGERRVVVGGVWSMGAKLTIVPADERLRLRAGSYNVDQLVTVTVSHNIDKDSAAITIQRFVRSTRFSGQKLEATTGAYMRYGDRAVLPELPPKLARHMCRSLIGALGYQDDGPGDPDHSLLRRDNLPDELMEFDVKDSPGISDSAAHTFPFVLVMEFILRVRMTDPRTGRTLAVVDFPFDSEIYADADPYAADRNAPHVAPNAPMNLPRRGSVVPQQLAKPKHVRKHSS